MSAVLLDTHAWVWLLNGSDRIGKKARKSIQGALNDSVVLVAAGHLKTIQASQ